MRACEADRCDAGATVNGRWCERHAYPTTTQPTVVVDGDPGPAAQEAAPEYALEGHSGADPVVEGILADKREALTVGWRHACDMIEEAERQLQDARDLRVVVLDNMRRTGMSLGDIAEVTGLTRQRIGQLLKG